MVFFLGAAVNECIKLNAIKLKPPITRFLNCDLMTTLLICIWTAAVNTLNIRLENGWDGVYIFFEK